MEWLRKLYARYQSILAYLFFGGCTTVLNWAAYKLCYQLLGMGNVISTILAWLIGVIFAYITNKLYVFQSRSFAPAVLKKEIPSFFSCRILTGVMDVVIMYITVSRLGWNADLWKLLSNILVIIANYAASKWFIFAKKPGGKA